jgi:hypothetical protein
LSSWFAMNKKLLEKIVWFIEKNETKYELLFVENFMIETTGENNN